MLARVETTGDKPVFCRTRRLPPEKYRALQVEVKRLIDQGVLSKSRSAWASPIVMVRKKNNTYRLCADFTALNKILKVQKYTLPNINDFSSLASGCKYFSCLDIKDAYYNIPVNEADKHKLTIATPLGNFCFNFLPMGLASSSAYYQQLMNEMVSGLPRVFSYLDDLIVVGRTRDEHDRTLCALLRRLSEHGLVVNESKCVWAVQSLVFLGHRVSVDGVSPAEQKVATIRDFGKPTSKRGLRRYLGMYQFYSRFVSNCAKYLQPLYNLISECPDNRPLPWDATTTDCFQESKDALAGAVTMAFPDPEAETEIVVDASAEFVGCVLQQVKEGTHRPLAFWSKALTTAQRQWSTFDRELYACYASIRHFSYYLDAKDFVLKTDHKPIVSRFGKSFENLTPRQRRYFDYIAQMTNKVEYVAGKNNVADVVSRPRSPADLNAVFPSQPIDYLALATEQERDPELQKLRLHNTTSLIFKTVPLADHGVTVLCDVSQGRLRVVVPAKFRYTIFNFYHGLSHPGVDGTTRLVKRSFVWFGMKKDLARWVSECRSCAKSKVHRHNIAEVETVVPPPEGRLTHVYIDLTGPLGTSSGYEYLMVIIDRFTRYVHAVPLADITADTCIEGFIRHWVAWAGCPQHIFTDRGPQFVSSAWADMCRYLGASLHHSTAYHPQAQGLIERFNRTLKNSLRACGDPSKWYDHLPWVLLALRNTPKPDLQLYSPSEILLGESVRLPGVIFEDRHTELSPDFVKTLSSFQALYSYSPPRPPARHQSFVDPRLFDRLTSHVYIRVDRHRPPLSPVYKGPYKILDRTEKYFLLDLLSKVERVSIDRLKTARLSLDTLIQEDTAATTTTYCPDGQTSLPSPVSTDDAASTPEVQATRFGRTVRRPAHLDDFIL